MDVGPSCGAGMPQFRAMEFRVSPGGMVEPQAVFEGSNNKRKRMSKDGLCVIVTGSASGLGAATAGILAEGGARLVINYSNSKNEAEATAEACRKAGSPEVFVVQGDVARDEDCHRIVAAAAPWGRLDALIS